MTFTLSIVALFCTLGGFSSQHAPELKVERKTAHIPAGEGQKPFNVTRHLIPLGEIQAGGPPRDGIPALYHPEFTSAAEADQVLKPSDVVLGLEFSGAAKAYPIRILNWHEVVNDDAGSQPVLVTWCPVCGSGVAYNVMANGQPRVFGVSGLLYKRNLLLYDHETDSLWSQIAGMAVTGELAGTPLELLPITQTTWARWKSEHPQTLALSFHTGFRREYSMDPYRDWIMDRRPALAVIVNGSVQLYPFSELKKAGTPFTDDIAGVQLTILFDSRDQTATVHGPNAEPIPHFVAFFSDARAFYPDAPVFKHR